MAWESKGDIKDKHKVLHKVLPECEPISKAPREILDFPAAHSKWGADLDRFEDEMRAQGAGKLYKAMDDSGDIYLIPNPWATRQVRESVGGRSMVKAIPRTLKMTWAEAKKIAAARTAAQEEEKPETDIWE